MNVVWLVVVLVEGLLQINIAQKHTKSIPKAYQKHKEAEKNSKDVINVQSERMWEAGLKEGINCLREKSTSINKGTCAQRMSSKKTQAQQWSTTSTKYRDGYAELYKCLTQGTDTKNSCLTLGENKLK